MGPALLLKVMSGDSLTIASMAFFRSGGSTSQTQSAVPNILASLAGGLAGMTGASHGTASQLNVGSSPVGLSLDRFVNNYDGTPATTPKAYLNWMVLDNQFQYDSASSGARPVTTPDQLLPLTQQIKLKKIGYLYIWVSNETKGWDVFFDNLKVTHYVGPMVEEDHYYPFGLTMAGISDKALKGGYVENKYRYNSGNELQNQEFNDGSGLETYDANFRMYDPQIGRFWQIDPFVEINEDWGPYTFASDNPILFNDPLGLDDSTASFPVGPRPVPVQPPVCLTCQLPKPNPGGNVPPPSSIKPLPINDQHSTLWHLWNDHNIATDIAYELNNFNPLAQGVNWVWTKATGHDSYGVQQNMVTASTRMLASLPIGAGGKIFTIGEEILTEGASSLFSYITPKIEAQMFRRGWSRELIHQVVNNPFATRSAMNRATGNIATAFFTKEGFYVVKDNVTNEIIQISNRLDPKWIPDATIVNPYIVK